MKINYIITGLFRSGGMRIIFEYANRLTERGHDVKLYFPYWPYNFQSHDKYSLQNIKNLFWRTRELYYHRKIKETLYPHKFEIKGVPKISNRYIRNADVVIATQWPTSYDVLELDPIKGFKVYFIQDYEKWNSNVELVDESYKLPISKITISNKLKNVLFDKFGAQSKVIYNGLNLNFFNNPTKVFRKEPKNILLIDHYLEKKGIDIGLRVCRELYQKYGKRVNFYSFGYEMYHKMPDYFQFCKNPNDDLIKEIYCKSDILIFPSFEEGFGLPPAEAMACKCATVTTNVGAIPEYAKNMESAIIVNPGDFIDMFQKVCLLVEDDDKLETISLEGYNAVKKFFDWNKSIAEFENYISNKVVGH